MTSSSSDTRNGDEGIEVPRYITMPEALWSLRHRFPSVLRFVLLQCIRCGRWVAQPVVANPPDVVPNAPLLKDANEMSTTAIQLFDSKDLWTKSGSREPRRHHAHEISDPPSKDSRSKSNCDTHIKKGRNDYFLPNPETFVCQWTYCEMGDMWADLRNEWLGEIYNALNVNDDEEHGKDTSRQMKHLPTNHKLLNEELAKELSLRRSERISRRPGISSTVDNKQSESGNSAESLHVNNLLQNDNAIASCFCWVICEKCGKLRQVEQPFPGGAPFVCALARNVRSCNLPNGDIMKAVAPNHSKRSFDRQCGDLALRNEVNIARHEQPVLPTLRNLTSTLRRKALGSFIKNVFLSPEEVRAKRDGVVRSLIAADTENPSDSPVRVNGKSPERKIVMDESTEKSNHGKHSKKDGGEKGGKPSKRSIANGDSVAPPIKRERRRADGSLAPSAKRESAASHNAARKRKRPAANVPAKGGAGGSKQSGGNRRRRRHSDSDEDEDEDEDEDSPETSSYDKDNDDDDDEIEVIHWVCCDLCNKWRIVPEKISASTKEWHCVMKEGTNCEDTDDEVRMNRASKNGKGNKAVS